MNEARPPHDESRLDELVRQLGADYNLPRNELDEERRARLFARIQDERRRQVRPRSLAPRPGSRRFQYAAMVAILLVGFALGRLSPGGDEPAVQQDPVAAVDATPGNPASKTAYRFAARSYLERTENLLLMMQRAAYAPDANTPWGTSASEPTAGWANDLLRETRLLQDSPAAKDDPQLRQLLEDLELLLAKLVQAADAHDGTDEIDDYRITSPEVLQRLRSQIDRNSLLNEI